MKKLLLTSLLLMASFTTQADTATVPQWMQAQVQTVGKFAQCGTKKYCKHMDSCAEAYYFLEQCDLTRLDRDKNGVPCESICGKHGQYR